MVRSDRWRREAPLLWAKVGEAERWDTVRWRRRQASPGSRRTWTKRARSSLLWYAHNGNEQENEQLTVLGKYD